MTHVVILDSRPRHVLERLTAFAQREANCKPTVFDFTLANGFFGNVRASDDSIIASATVWMFETAWLGNVVVARHQRRKGHANTVIRALMHELDKRNPGLDLCLLASPLGVHVYPKLGFRRVEEVQISLVELAPSPPPCESSSPVQAVKPSMEQHQAAVEFYEQSTGSSRKEVLSKMFAETGKCAVVEHHGRVVAAAWARCTGREHITQKPAPGILLGPVVAESPHLASLVCSQLLRSKFKDGAEQTMSQEGAISLVAQRRGSEAELSVFKALGFSQTFELPYMVKESSSPQNGIAGGLDFGAVRPNYFALIGFEYG